MEFVRLYIKCFVLNTNFDYSLVFDLTIRPQVHINLHVQLIDGQFERLRVLSNCNRILAHVVRAI